MPKKPLAAVTMVFNEPDLLPVWLAHYSREVGLRNCFVIDHGSTEGLDILAGVPHVRKLAHVMEDEGWRCGVVSQFCAMLLGDYERVAYTDVDELLVADPARAAGLIALCQSSTPDVVTAFGMDLVQAPGEAAIDFGRPVSAQRGWARPYSSLCKPSLVRRPARWCAGFHYADAASRFGGLYLFHLAYVDYDMIARRQLKRNQTARAAGVTTHHDIAPEDMVRHIRRDYAGLPKRRAPTLGGPAEQGFVARLLETGARRDGHWTIAAGTHPSELWEIPATFRGKF